MNRPTNGVEQTPTIVTRLKRPISKLVQVDYWVSSLSFARDQRSGYLRIITKRSSQYEPTYSNKGGIHQQTYEADGTILGEEGLRHKKLGSEEGGVNGVLGG